MRINATPTDLIDQLRAWFHPKDRSVVMADDCFIEGDEISTPDNPRIGRRRLYAKSGCWYDLDSNGTETSLCANNIIDRWGDVVSSWLLLPGLVGFWPFSSVQRSTGNVYDVSGQGRTLTYTGAVTSIFNIYNNFVPYLDLDGVTNYLSRADETDLDVLGTETINAVAVRGLTVGGWFWIDTIPGAGAGAGYIGKWTGAGNQRSYLISQTNTSIVMNVSTDGINTVSSAVANTTTGVWKFLVGRFNPSTTVSIFVNATETQNAVGIPASVFNSTAAFQVGAYNAGANLLDGRTTLLFLSYQLFSNALINAMWQQSRVLFGV